MKDPSRLTWRLAAVSTAVVAIGLAGIGIALALQQAQALTVRLMSNAELRARQIAATATYQFSNQQARLLEMITARECADAYPVRPETSPLPAWVDGVYVWNEATLRVVVPATQGPDRMEQLMADRLSARPPTQVGEETSSQARFVYDTIGDAPVIIATVKCSAAGDRGFTVVARVGKARLLTGLLEPLVGQDPGLELVAAEQPGGPWRQPLSGPMSSWAIQPTEAFQLDQRRMVLGQTMTYVTLTVLALATLLCAMWFLVRAWRRNVALAEMKSDFVADVSHELKTPLALIRLFAETLQSGRVSSEEKRLEYYSIISRESTRLTKLIDNILDFARIEAGRNEYKLEAVDIGNVVRDTYEAYRAELDHHGFDHRLSVAEALPPVDADRDAISAALVNLMGNAIKYAGDERYLAITVLRDTRRGCNGVLITVEDRGIGIRPDDRARVFEGFFRSSDGRVRKTGGTGLGLTLVKHIIDAHSGTLEVESRLVKGTAFRIFLPAGRSGNGARSQDGPPRA